MRLILNAPGPLIFTLTFWVLSSTFKALNTSINRWHSNLNSMQTALSAYLTVPPGSLLDISKWGLYVQRLVSACSLPHLSKWHFIFPAPPINAFGVILYSLFSHHPESVSSPSNKTRIQSFLSPMLPLWSKPWSRLGYSNGLLILSSFGMLVAQQPDWPC